MRGDFDWLSGIVRIAAPRPEALDGGLAPYYVDPNDARWGAVLSRVVFHESLHFWQLLGGGYMANLVAEDWRRMLAFEETGAVPPPGPLGAGWRVKAPELPFAAEDLVEAVARFWDVHTRSPVRILIEEGMPEAQARALEGPADERGLPSYSGEAYDLVMTRNARGSRYERPYLWVLERLDGDSTLAQIVFPIVAHGAFGSPKPVELFTGALERAAEPGLRCRLRARHCGLINRTWPAVWPHAIEETLAPVARALGLPNFTDGFAAIERGPLAAHPLYRTYPSRRASLHWAVVATAMRLDELPPSAARDTERAAVGAALGGPLAVFGLPGLPTFRSVLGQAMPPPAVRFRGAASEAGWPESGPEAAGSAPARTADGWSAAVDALAARVDRFRLAEAIG